MDADESYLIFACDKNAWRKAPTGYTLHLPEALHFSRSQALAACFAAMSGTVAHPGALSELPVRLLDLRVLVDVYATRHPGREEPWL